VLQLFALQRRYPEMLEACRAAAAIEYVVVATQAPGVVLPDHLEDELVRLNLVVGRDTAEVLLDEWGIRCTLTFRGRRHDVALPWPAVLAGGLRPPRRDPRSRFAVIEGGKK
jgi:stringent starvation protein B